MGIFSDIYNTVAKFFRPQEEQGEASNAVAASRLKLVLMQDRTNLTPKILEQMRGELIDLLSRYVELDKELLELDFQQEGDQVALMLSIPVIRAKDEEEIEAAGVNLKVNINDESEEDEVKDDEDCESNENDENSDSEDDSCNDESELSLDEGEDKAVKASKRRKHSNSDEIQENQEAQVEV